MEEIYVEAKEMMQSNRKQNKNKRQRKHGIKKVYIQHYTIKM